jgi:hypothetical protein
MPIPGMGSCGRAVGRDAFEGGLHFTGFGFGFFRFQNIVM